MAKRKASWENKDLSMALLSLGVLCIVVLVLLSLCEQANEPLSPEQIRALPTDVHTQIESEAGSGEVLRRRHLNVAVAKIAGARTSKRGQCVVNRFST